MRTPGLYPARPTPPCPRRARCGRKASRSEKRRHPVVTYGQGPLSEEDRAYLSLLFSSIIEVLHRAAPWAQM